MISIYDYTDIKKYLRDYIDFKRELNNSLSLRSFAKMFGVSPSYLSSILSGKKPFSEKIAISITEKLKLSTDESYYFSLLLSLSKSPDELRPLVLKKISIEQTRSVTYSATVTHYINWQYLLILVFLQSFEGSKVSTVEFLSSRLEKSSQDVLEMLEYLVKEGYLIEENGVLKRKNTKLVLESKKENSFLKDLHLQYLKECEVLLFKNSVEKRFSVTEFLEVPESKYEELIKITNNYLDEIASLNQASGNDNKKAIGVSLHLNEH